MTLNEALKGDDIELIELYLQLVYQNEGLSALNKEFKDIKRFSFMEINGKIRLIQHSLPGMIWLKDPTKSILIELNNNDND